MDYLIVTPVKNEADRIGATLQSVMRQTVKPREWIIIDDFSTDGTADIIRRHLPHHQYMRLLTAPQTPAGDYSSRVVQLVKFGLARVRSDAEMIVKLDGDVQFGPDFFAGILSEFEQNPQLGIASGLLTENGVPEDVDISSGNTRGATKCYRRSCLSDIGGLYASTGWDTIDNAAARARSWETRILPFEFEHLKPEGSGAGSALYNHYRTGLANGRIPYHGLYFTLKALSKAMNPPVLLGPLAQALGYCQTRFLRRERPFPRFISNQVRKEQRTYLVKRLARLLPF